jgi:Hypothetical protein (DUF2513)
MPDSGLQNLTERPTIRPLTGRGWLVKRDMDLVRRIMVHVQDKPSLRGDEIKFDDVDDEIVGRHVELLFDEGLIDGAPASFTHLAYKTVRVRDLSWAGHDFVAALQNEGVWEKLKQRLSPAELATAPLSLIKTLSVGLLEQYFKSKLGL